ncbi:p21-activated protein kinase-interacting protein 1 [Ambystoma mexicanum]|uniref:p21-activated protein kinase-interacting protein 1 n=1 Tax=Ambystoma mexicanum TaxID=8296 RepID=UPI0037E989A2
MERRVQLLGGCYEQILFGFRVEQREGQKWTVVADFTHHAHTASLSAISANNRYVATGSKDETIQIYDMKKKVEHGALLHHNGTISCLEFYGTAHLLSGAEDGLICVWSTKKWECQKSIGAHKGHVTSLSIHPSGKLALSVGTDKTLRTWNLIEGRSAFIKNLKQNAHIVRWSPTGDKYIVVANNTADIYKLETASVIGSITHERRISSIQFVTDSILAVAGEEESVRLYDCNTLECVCEFKAHEKRVKCIYGFELEGLNILASASTDGFMKLWKIELDEIQNPPSLLCEVDTSARLTCLSVWLEKDMEVKETASERALPTTAKKPGPKPEKKKQKLQFAEPNNADKPEEDSPGAEETSKPGALEKKRKRKKKKPTGE